VTTTLGAHDLVLCAATVPGVSIFDRVALARDHGFRGVSTSGYDLHTAEKAGLSPADLAMRVADEGLAISEFDAVTEWLDAHHSGAGVRSNPRPGQTAETVCPMAAAVGARTVTLVEMVGCDVGVDEAAEGFARVCDVAAEHGLTVALEFGPWGGVPTLTRALDVVRATDRPNATLLVDSWHLFRSGGTLAQLAATPKELIGDVQIDDAPRRAEPDLWEETTHRRRVPGEGDFDLVGFVATLTEVGYDGPLGVEVLSDDLAGLPPDEIVRRCADGTRAVLDHAR
jgi:sugar phosphate isomerase/epimerase